MKRTNLIFLTIAILLTVASCSNPKKELLDSIENLENELYSAQSLDKIKGVNLINLYVNYSKEFSEDTASASFLYKAAELSMNMQLGTQAIGYYDEIISKYPNYSKKPECLFLKAFIYENQLNELEKAKTNYTQFITEYPAHQLAKDAEASLKYLGKSPEELVIMFQEMNEN